MKKVLVTGGSGFIGGYVIEELQSRGFSVMRFDHSDPGYVKDASPGVETFLGDIRDATAVTEAAAHVDGIVHLAAVLGTQETIANPRPAAETNVLGGLNVLEAAVQYDLPLVYAGVGNHWMRNHGGGTYTITKSVLEDFIKMFNKYRGGRMNVVRPVNAYGPRQSIAAPFGSSKVRKIVPSFACRALLGQPVEVYGDGSQISDCVFVGDVAKVFVTALEYTEEIGSNEQAFEVGPTQSHLVNDVARMIISRAAELTGAKSTLTHLPMRPGEVPNAVVSAEAETLQPLGIDANDFVPLEVGLRQTVTWYYENWYRGLELGTD
jgi:UDP-glucose 4-epimerase